MCEFEALSTKFRKTVKPRFRGAGKGFDDLLKIRQDPVSFMNNDALLQVSEFVKSHSPNSKVAVVFDLDSTLFCVSSRTQAILRHLADEDSFQSQYKNVAAWLKGVEVRPEDWGFRALIERHAPHGPIEMFQAIREFWKKHFFSNEYLHHDVIYPHAEEYVRHLEGLGAEIFYLTGRPEASMRPGTLAALAKWGFPLDSHAHLLMKPSEVEADEHFKTVTLKKMAVEFDHIWFFENEPLIIQEVRGALPHIRIVYVETVHSGKADPPVDLPRIGMGFHGRWRL